MDTLATRVPACGFLHGHEPELSGELRQVIRQLSDAARSAPVGPVTVQFFVARLDKLARQLALVEGTLDEAVDEEMACARAVHAAVGRGTVLRFPRRPGIATRSDVVA